jgi:hypothetical protein
MPRVAQRQWHLRGEDVPAIIASVYHVVTGIGILDAQYSRHMARKVAKVQGGKLKKSESPIDLLIRGNAPAGA